MEEETEMKEWKRMENADPPLVAMVSVGTDDNFFLSFTFYHVTQ